MTVKLRHEKFPLVIIYRDPKASWDEFVKGKVLEEIKEKGFDDFVTVKEPDEQETPNESR